MPRLSQKIISTLPQPVRSHLAHINPRQLFSLLLEIRILGLLLATLGLWGFGYIADEILEKESFAFDKSILLALRELNSPVLDRVMAFITWFGEPAVLLIVGISLGFWLLIKNKRSSATTLAIAAAGAVGLNYTLKQIFRRQRPLLWERIVDVTHYSFPSGHAMVSMVVYGMIGYLLATHLPRWRRWIISSTILLIILIGLSRLYLGVHWPTDIIAGYAAGFVWLTACIFSMEIWHKYYITRHQQTLDGEERGESTEV